MKHRLKLFGILFLGLVTAAVIYPFLHEFGHAAAAVLLGAEVLEFNMFPDPYILCNMRNLSEGRVIIVGLSGLICPVIFSGIFLRLFGGCFWNRYVSFLLRLISVLAFAISAAAVILNHFGTPIKNDDVTQILYMYPDSGIMIFTLSVFLSIYLIIEIILDKPVKRCFAYFGL